MSARQSFVVGVDGCPGGWLAVIRPLDDPAASSARLYPRFRDLLDALADAEMVAVDIPIGLPARAGPGGRAADAAARAVLGSRRSSVFAVPSRAAIYAASYPDACAVALATSEPPRKVAKQTFQLFRKIREVDALMTPVLQRRVRECHPELAFWALSGECALEQPKKVRSRVHAPGMALRMQRLSAAGYRPQELLGHGQPRARVGDDDVLDAAAASWSAWRMARGQGRSFPLEPACDARGLRMQIWC